MKDPEHPDRYDRQEVTRLLNLRVVNGSWTGCQEAKAAVQLRAAARELERLRALAARSRMPLGVDDLPLVQPCPHCDKAIAVGTDQRAKKFEPVAPQNCEQCSGEGFYTGESGAIEACDACHTRPPIDATNQRFVADLLLRDPLTGEELFPEGPGEDRNGTLILVARNKDGSRRWQHSLRTEEL